MIWIIARNPNSYLKIHQIQMFDGIGSSAIEFLIIFVTGEVFMIFMNFCRRYQCLMLMIFTIAVRMIGRINDY